MPNVTKGRRSRNIYAAAASLFCFLIILPACALSQNYPTFSGGAQGSPVQKTNVSPAAISFNGLLRIYYTGTGGETIYSATSTGGSGTNFPLSGPYPGPHPPNSATSGPAAVIYNNEVYLAWTNSGLIY